MVFLYSQQERLARVEDRSQLALRGRDGRRRRGCCGSSTGETFLKALSTDFQLTFDWHSTEFRLTFDWLFTDFRLTFDWLSTDLRLTCDWLATDLRLTFNWHSTDFLLTFNWHSFWISTCGSPGDQAESIRGGGGGRRLLTWDALEEAAGQPQCCSRHGGCHVLLGFLCLGEGTSIMYCLKPTTN